MVAPLPLLTFRFHSPTNMLQRLAKKQKTQHSNDSKPLKSIADVKNAFALMKDKDNKHVVHNVEMVVYKIDEVPHQPNLFHVYLIDADAEPDFEKIKRALDDLTGMDLLEEVLRVTVWGTLETASYFKIGTKSRLQKVHGLDLWKDKCPQASIDGKDLHP